MDIYNEYGATVPEVEEKLSVLEREVYKKFLETFPEASLPELRILFHIFQFGLNGRMAEDILYKALKKRKALIREKTHENETYQEE